MNSAANTMGPCAAQRSMAGRLGRGAAAWLVLAALLAGEEAAGFLYTLDAPTGNNGPGGFESLGTTSSLKLWLNAGAGVESALGVPAADGANVQFWRDQSGNANDASQGTSSARPYYRSSGTHTINGNPSLDFDAGDYMVGTSGFGAGITGTFFVVGMLAAPAASGQWDRIFTTHQGASGNSGRGLGLCLSQNSTTLNPIAGTQYPYPGADPGTSNPYLSAIVDTTNSDNIVYNVARSTDGQWNNLNGDIAEIVVFIRGLNAAERLVVSNALGAKYGIGLGADDHYAGDDPAQGDYDLEVFGIGRVNAASQLLIAGAAGMAIEASAGTLGDGEWLLAGHRLPANSLVDTPFGSRWARTWYLDKLGNLDAAVTFDYSDAGLSAPATTNDLMLYSADGVSFAPLSLVGVVSGDQIAFLVPDSLLASGYYTLGTIENSAVPEPTTLAILGLALLIRRRRQACN